MDTVQLNLDLTPVQLRGCAALVRNLNPVLVERIASESGEAECIFAALDELQSALSCRDLGSHDLGYRQKLNRIRMLNSERRSKSDKEYTVC